MVTFLFISMIVIGLANLISGILILASLFGYHDDPGRAITLAVLGITVGTLLLMVSLGEILK